MSKTVELSHITTDPQSSVVEHVNFIATDERGLDGLEYHLGLWRGDIARYRDQPIMSTSLHADMVELLETSSWALLPPNDILHTIQDLYQYNRKRSIATDKRKLFTDVLPEDVYEYELMPVCTADRRAVHVSGKCYEYPYRNMPRIRSTVHPCFVLRLLARYRRQDVNLEYTPSPVSTDDSLRSLLSEIAIVASSCVNLSWLHGTWYDFPERGVTVARPDPKPLARESLVAKEEDIRTDEERDPRPSNTRTSSAVPTTTCPSAGKQRRLTAAERGVAVARRNTELLVPEEEEEEEEIHTDEERDLEDPRLVLARYKLLRYMATHNTRIRSRVPPSTTAGNVQKSESVPAAPPTAGSSADVPGKRKRSTQPIGEQETVSDEPEKRRSKRLILARKS